MNYNKLLPKVLAVAALSVLPSTALWSATSPYQSRQQSMGQQSMKQSATDEEQEFASQLSSLHRQVFLNQFNNMQRAEAMALVDAERGKKYSRMTPDMAVEEVLKSHRGEGQDSYSQQQQQTSPRYRGGGQGYNNRSYQSPNNNSRGYSSGSRYQDDEDDYSKDSYDTKSSKKKWWQKSDNDQSSSQNKKGEYWD